MNSTCEPCGVCVGVASMRLPSDRLIGSDDYSVGLHCSGSIVRNRGAFQHVGTTFAVGDRIGCAVYNIKDDEETSVGVAFFVNNRFSTSTTLPTHSIDLGRDLFAAVSLYKAGTRIVMLCCEEDWQLDPENLVSKIGVLPTCMCSPDKICPAD